MKGGFKKFVDTWNKKLIIAFLMLIIIVASTIYLIVDNKKMSVVATINGEPIFDVEFKHRLLSNRADICSYFAQKYGVKEDAKFWNNSFNGEVPINMAKQKTLEQLIRIKIEQILAREKGIIDDISYSAFLKSFENENTMRKEFAKDNKIIYGAINYNEQEYFAYIYSNMIKKLKDYLKNNEFTIDEAAIREKYEKEKEKYKKNASVKVQKVYVNWEDNKKEERDNATIEAERIIKLVKEELNKGKDPESLVNAYNQDNRNILKLKFTEQNFNDNTARDDSDKYPLLRAYALKLSLGEVSDVIQLDNTFCVIKCVEKEGLDYIPYEQIRPVLIEKFVDEKYENLINALCKEAKININTKVYDRININYLSFVQT